MQESKWIRFQELPNKPTAKTKVYDVLTKEGISVKLGTIKWFGSWRKYAFFPVSNTIFETDCLNDIVSFIKHLMLERKVESQQTNNG